MDMQYYPNIKCILCIYLTLPVTTCSCSMLPQNLVKSSMGTFCKTSPPNGHCPIILPSNHYYINKVPQAAGLRKSKM